MESGWPNNPAQADLIRDAKLSPEIVKLVSDTVGSHS